VRHERLAQLPAGERAHDPEYRAMNATDRAVCDALAALPADRRAALSRDIQRRQTFEFYKDLLAFRAASPAARSDSEVRRIYAHDANGVMAFSRAAGGDEVVVVSNLARFPYPGYGLELPSGRWKIAFNSDQARYGGEGAFSSELGTHVDGGFARVGLPAGGVVVLTRVG
jgi:maltooligosyltrehalose trehalohydrolase